MSRSKMTYEEMISMLQSQTYSAPNTWSSIESDLDLGETISQLKTHTAPEDLWSKIDTALDIQVGEIETVNDTKIGINGWYYLIAVAALFGILAMWILPDTTQSNVSYSSEVEVTSQVELKPNVNNANVQVTQAFDFINQNDFLYTAKEQIDYEKQLAELQEAKKEILNMQEQYGVDKNTQKMLAKIERDIAKLLKSMIKAA